MSWDDTARMSCGCEGKRCSTFLDCWTPGSLVEKKKFPSTTGLRSTKSATRTNNKIVIASMTHCALNQDGLVAMEAHITRFNAVANGSVKGRIYGNHFKSRSALRIYAA